MEEGKREKIVSAALHEFRGGYKAAHTDEICRAAGISKGLLFHYFGTKARLYSYLVEHAVAAVEQEFTGAGDTAGMDVLAAIRHMTLAKRDISLQKPAIFDFITNAYMDTTMPDPALREKLEQLIALRARYVAGIIESADYSMLREGIAPAEAVKVIQLVIQGYSAKTTQEARHARTTGEAVRENYDIYLQEFDEILSVLRKALYK
jgi:AcrR family transcriptional regulator